MGRFFVCVGDEADVAWGRWQLRKQACGFQEDCHGGDIVIGPKSARSLLKNTDLRLYDVAERCGFGSPQAFNRTFKAETGVTPLNYRRQSLSLPGSN